MISSFHRLAIVARLVFDLFIIALCVYNLIRFSLEAPFWQTAMWYSEWAVWFGCFFATYDALLCILVLLNWDSLEKFVWKSSRSKEIAADSTQWYHIFFHTRDLFFMAWNIQITLTSTAFWVAYFVAPWPIDIVSYIAHGWLWLAMIFQFGLSTYFMSYWDVIVSVGYTATYYCYLIWLLYQGVPWPYGALDPKINSLWWLFPAFIPVAQIIYWMLFIFINYTKNKIYAAAAKSYDLTGLEIPYRLGITTRGYARMEMTMASALVLYWTLFGITFSMYCLNTMGLSAPFLSIYITSMIVEIFMCVVFVLWIFWATYVILFRTTSSHLMYVSAIAANLLVIRMYWAAFSFGRLWSVGDLSWVFFGILAISAFQMFGFFVFHYFYMGIEAIEKGIAENKLVAETFYFK